MKSPTPDRIDRPVSPFFWAPLAVRSAAALPFAWVPDAGAKFRRRGLGGVAGVKVACQFYRRFTTIIPEYRIYRDRAGSLDGDRYFVISRISWFAREKYQCK